MFLGFGWRGETLSLTRGEATDSNSSLRLIHLNLPTLKYRRLREDMIEVFKIIHNIYMLQKYHDSLCLTKGQIGLIEVITINF